MVKSSKTTFKEGHVPWNKGVKGWTTNTKAGFQKGHGNIGGGVSKGRHLSVKSEFKKGQVPWNKGLRGVMKAWNKGMGIKPRNRNLDHARYGKWRDKVYKRDNWTCVVCKVIGGRLQADHIKPWCEFPRLRYRVSNGQTLCKKCHLEKTRKDLSKYWKNQFTQSKLRSGTRSTLKV